MKYWNNQMPDLKISLVDSWQISRRLSRDVTVFSIEVRLENI